MSKRVKRKFGALVPTKSRSPAKRRVSEEGKKRTVENPFGLWFPQIGDEIKPPFPAPDLTDEDYAPDLPGYRRVDTLFVDRSGWGSDNEPALSGGQFIEYVKEQLAAGKRYGYGVIDCGPFQLYLGVYQALPSKKRRRSGRGRVTEKDVDKLRKRVADLRERRLDRGSAQAEVDLAQQQLPGVERKLREAEALINGDVGPELSEKEVRAILRRRLLKALKRAHYDEEDQTCDICVGITEDLVLFAARSLLSATEADDVADIYDQLAPTKEELAAEELEFDKLPFTECDECGAHTFEVNDYRPDYCYACRKPISWDGDADEQDADDVEVEEGADRSLGDGVEIEQRWVTPDEQLSFDFERC